jgi:pimeloyl-ACP methyl ester carboxylesterase
MSIGSLPLGALKGSQSSAETRLTDLHVPRRRAINIATTDGPGQIAALEFGNANRPLSVLFLHANGFNAGTYRTALAPLASDHRVLAIDMRGHGRTQLPAPETGLPWTIYADDLLAVLAALDECPTVIAGHSLGGATALLTVPRINTPSPPRLVLIDPVLPPRAAFTATPKEPEWDFPLSRGARKRRDSFSSTQEAHAAYQGRGAFRTWPDAALRDYLTDGLRQGPDGIWRLACAPAWEAANFAHYAMANPYPALDNPKAPIHILRAENESTCHYEGGPTTGLVHMEIVPGTTHFIPMEKPGLVAEALRRAAAA